MARGFDRQNEIKSSKNMLPFYCRCVVVASISKHLAVERTILSLLRSALQLTNSMSGEACTFLHACPMGCSPENLQLS